MTGIEGEQAARIMEARKLSTYEPDIKKALADIAATVSVAAHYTGAVRKILERLTIRAQTHHGWPRREDSPAGTERVVYDADIDAAFRCFTRGDGPRAAYYERQEANSDAIVRLKYSAVHLRGATREGVVRQVKKFADDLSALGVKEIVWRSRPELIEIVGKNDWQFYCRLLTVPYLPVPGVRAPNG